MKKKFTFFEKLRFHFDNLFSMGIKGPVIVLLSILIFCSLIAAFIVYKFNLYPPQEGYYPDYLDYFWQSISGVMDVFYIPLESSWGLRFVSVFTTLVDLFFLSLLISIVSLKLEEKVANLRKGRSLVPISNHSLILGWSDKLIPIINQLTQARLTGGKINIVILADKDKVEMEDAINEKVDKKNVNIICRSGVPYDMDDLAIVNPDDAKSIIILSPEDENADLFTIKTVMAITKNQNRKSEKYHIIAQLKDYYNYDAAKVVGGDEVVYLKSTEFIAKLVTVSCRQPGLSNVMMDLFSYEGQEIYIKKCEELEGKTYEDAVLAFENDCIIGVFNNNKIYLNPSESMPLRKGAEYLVISETDVYLPSPTFDPPIQKASISHIDSSIRDIEKFLILGWSERCPHILKELNDFASKGSYALIVSDQEGVAKEIEEIKKEITHIEISHISEDPSLPKVLESLEIDKFDDAILIGDLELETQLADAKTMLTLIQLRTLSNKLGKRLNIVTEIFDMKNRKIITIDQADDFIISDDIISLVLTQYSENVHLKTVFDDLLSEKGNEIYLQPASNYVEIDKEVNFYTIAKSALLKGETAIGYKLNEYQFLEEKNYGIVLNPKKTDNIIFSNLDKIIVISQK